MFFYAYFLIPETKGMSLEKMDELFGITEILRVMQDMDHQRVSQRQYSHRTTAEYELRGEDKWQRHSEAGNSQREILEIRQSIG